MRNGAPPSIFSGLVVAFLNAADFRRPVALDCLASQTA